MSSEEFHIKSSNNEALFPNLFSSIKIGNLTVKNRILSSGHNTIMAKDGQITEQLIAYHEARAAGGVGLIVVQVVAVHESAKYAGHTLMGDNDSIIPGFKRLADAIKKHGAKVFVQLFHPGREMNRTLDGSMPTALAPSAVSNERMHVMPRAMTTNMAYELINAYISAAKRLKTAGVDGVEIVASHGYLPAQFLNPRSNLRTDEFGGSLKNRCRFLRLIIEGIRTELGNDFVIGVRISGDERSVDGLELSEVIEVCHHLKSEEGIDYLSVCAGASTTLAGSAHIVPSMSNESAYTAPLAETLKQNIDVPIMVAGRINQPHEAEMIIKKNQADMCAMTRALICDPLLPVKAQANQPEAIRACIGCNQACIGHFHKDYPISCIQRPETGREIQYGVKVKSSNPKFIMVAGGGPAGLKAAAVAAERGHRVELYEAQQQLGGQVLLAQKIPGRMEFGGAVTNLLAEIERYGVITYTGVPVTGQLIKEKQPDAVIVATGAKPRKVDLELIDSMPVFNAWQILEGVRVPTGRVLVADWRPDWIGLGVAIDLAQKGNPVILAVNAYQAGEFVQQYVRNDMLAQAYKLGVEILPLRRIFGADESNVYLQNVLTAEPEVIENISSLVLSLGHESVDDLTQEFEHEEGIDIFPIGDCVSPRTVEEAVLEALKVSCSV